MDGKATTMYIRSDVWKKIKKLNFKNENEKLYETINKLLIAGLEKENEK